MSPTWDYARAVLRHWRALVTGSLPIAVYTVLVLGFKDEPGKVWHAWNHIPQWAVMLLALLGLMLAQYRAWRDMKRERDALQLELQKTVTAVVLQRSEEYVYLEISNRSAAANFWATLAVDAAISPVGMPHHEVFARWDHVETTRASIPRHGRHRLRIGRLESNRGSPTWYIPYSSNDKAGEARAYYSWTYGPSYEETVAGSAVTLRIVLFADPELRDGPIIRKIELRGPDAIDVT